MTNVTTPTSSTPTERPERRNGAADDLRRYLKDRGWEFGITLLDHALDYERAPDGECPPCIDAGVAHVVGMPPHVTADPMAELCVCAKAADGRRFEVLGCPVHGSRHEH